MVEQQQLIVTTLGECRHPSPLNLESASHEHASFFVSDSRRIRLDVAIDPDPANVGDTVAITLAINGF